MQTMDVVGGSDISDDVEDDPDKYNRFFNNYGNVLSSMEKAQPNS